MQLHNDYLVLARGVTTDTDDKTISLFKLINEVAYNIDRDKFMEILGVEPGNKVTLPASFVLASAWSATKKAERDTKLTASSVIFGPDGEELGASQVHEITLPKGADNIKLNMVSEAMPATRSGKYIFEVKIRDESSKVLGEAECFLKVTINIDKSERKAL